MYSEILIPTDGTKSMTKVIDCGLDLAEQYDARVHVLHVVDSDLAEFPPDGDQEQVFEWAETVVEEVAEQAQYADLDVVTAVREGIPDDIILEYAEENNIDLIVIGLDKPNAIGEYATEVVAEYLLGGTADHVVKRAHVPVVTVRV